MQIFLINLFVLVLSCDISSQYSWGFFRLIGLQDYHTSVTADCNYIATSVCKLINKWILMIGLK